MWKEEEEEEEEGGHDLCREQWRGTET